MFRPGLALLSTAIAAPLLAQTAGSDVPRATYIQVQDREFAKMDADKDGQVTRAESEAFLRAAAVAQAGQRARAAFSELDSDRNGQLSFVEFAKIQRPATAVNGQPFVTQFDANKDGRVSLVEHRAGKLRSFDGIDADKDGIVTIAEMRAAGVIK
ncbi:EF-hand domain-containing protein [Sphingomonas mesophila]|uniref:EF-hand domain-containing protein n=1 Tax=Sphingomonas mesophila TaxID=2303576 RepID=UPI000E574C38|nr:EF-hand domain-containing protein [Sphingomonas mesophila]